MVQKNVLLLYLQAALSNKPCKFESALFWMSEWKKTTTFTCYRTPSKVMQTFSANFCRCVVSEAMVSFKANSTDLHMVKQALPAPHIPILAISGSEPSDIELWSLEVCAVLLLASQLLMYEANALQAIKWLRTPQAFDMFLVSLS